MTPCILEEIYRRFYWTCLEKGGSIDLLNVCKFITALQPRRKYYSNLYICLNYVPTVHVMKILLVNLGDLNTTVIKISAREHIALHSTLFLLTFVSLLPLLLLGFNETWILPTDFRKKNSNIEFHVNPSTRSKVILYGRTDRRTATTKLIVDFRNFANAPRICYTRVSSL